MALAIMGTDPMTPTGGPVGDQKHEITAEEIYAIQNGLPTSKELVDGLKSGAIKGAYTSGVEVEAQKADPTEPSPSKFTPFTLK